MIDRKGEKKRGDEKFFLSRRQKKKSEKLG